VSGDGLLFLGGDAPADPTALKERAAASLERALAFVVEHGDSLAQLRAHVALQAEPAAVLTERMAALQAADGSFAPVSEACRGWLGRVLLERRAEDRLRGTLEALAILSDARQDDAPAAEAAVRFVESLQAEDGSFACGLADESAVVVVTGMAAGSLGRSRYARPEGLADAGAWLGTRFNPDLVEQGHAECAAFAMYYSNAPDDLADEVLQWCGRALEKGFRSHAAESLAVMQVLLACQVGSLPGASFAPEELLERLLGEQAPDGGFAALEPGGPVARVASTTDAMRAVIGLCATF